MSNRRLNELAIGEWTLGKHGWIVSGDRAICLISNMELDGQQIEDASLIAAAPKLLAALEDCVNWLDWLYHPTNDDKRKSQLRRIERARAAIAKAKGLTK